jgi:hypothetical protein
MNWKYHLSLCIHVYCYETCLCVWFMLWMIFITYDYLMFYVPFKNISLIWRRHHCRWRAAKSRPMLGAHGLWAGRDLYRATPTVTRDLGFSGPIRKTAPISRFLRHAWRCEGPILTRILTGIITYDIFTHIHTDRQMKIQPQKMNCNSSAKRSSLKPCNSNTSPMTPYLIFSYIS